MIGVILAAGKGSRLGSLTEDTPKSLLELNNNTTLLDYNLNILEILEINKTLIITGFQSNKINSHVKNRANVTCILNPFWDCCNVLGSLYMGLPYIHEDFLFLHADTIVDEEIWKQLKFEKGDIVLPYKQKVCGDEEMKVKHNNLGELSQITKEMNPEDADGEFLGIAKFSGNVLNYLLETSRNLLSENLNLYMESIIEDAIKKKMNITTFEIGNSNFVEVDFEEDYLLAKKLFS
jgi:choline kinase